MKRRTKIIWIAAVFTTIVAAAVAGVVVYFTAFRKSSDSSSSSAVSGGATSETDPGATTTPEATSATSPGPASPSPAGSTDVSTRPPRTSIPVDHLAHAVPGYEYKQVDYDGNGYEDVQLDGSRSHTHYTEGDPIVQGRLVSMSWFDNSTKKQLATIAKPLLRFKIGSTVVGLTVVDNSGDSHTDYAFVIVETPVFPGAYCYFYPPPSADVPDITVEDENGTSLSATYAVAVEQLEFQDASAFPSEVRDDEFQMRCMFLVDPTEEGGAVSFTAMHYGAVRLLVDGDVVLESDDDGERTTAGDVTLADDGQYTAQILYSRSSSAAAKLVLNVTGGGELQYNVSTILPVLSAIEPLSSTLEGGGSAKITGIGLINGVYIDFGGMRLEIDEDQSTEEVVYVIVPRSTVPRRVEVRAVNNAGVSNPLVFEYKRDGEPPIKFEESTVKMQGTDKNVDVQLVTGIKYGPDHRYYMSALHSVVYSMETDASMKVTDLCMSSGLGLNRAILGLAFNPADTEFKLYVSGSVLEWKEKEKLDGPLAWANGEVMIVQKDVDGACLGKVGESIITGLPVTNYDHGVNGMVFDQDGKLHFQVGGFTNAGVRDVTKLGGMDANPLSGASLVADVNKPGFDGAIRYSTSNPALANQVSGDVSVYMAGLRNSFGINIHSNGYIYATDNGASVDFGPSSTSCTTEEVLTGDNLQDELVRVIEGRYGGHPNRNRGRSDPRQCVFRAPDEPSDDFYEAPVATFESSTNGVLEYTANTFQGQLKGDVLCSKFSTQESPGRVFRLQIGDDGEVASGPDELWPSSGLSIEMSPFGHLLMPVVFGKVIILLSPVEVHRDGAGDEEDGVVPVFTAVMPFRGGRGGGNRVIVTGAYFKPGAVAVFGDKPCTDVEDVAEDGRSFTCVVPAASDDAPNGVAVGLQFDDELYNIAPGSGVDYLYMNV